VMSEGLRLHGSIPQGVDSDKLEEPPTLGAKRLYEPQDNTRERAAHKKHACNKNVAYYGGPKGTHQNRQRVTPYEYTYLHLGAA